MSELQRCRNILTDLHNRISKLERGQVSALRASDSAASNAGTRPATLASAASVDFSYQSSVSQPSATTAVSAGPLSNQYAATSTRPSTRPAICLEVIHKEVPVEGKPVAGASSHLKKRKYKPT